MKAWIAILAAAIAFAQSPGNRENGKRLFTKDVCYECHGYDGQGGRDGPRIAATPLNLQALSRYVRRPFGAMPAFTAKVLPDQDLTDIYAYLKSLPVAKSPKDVPLLKQMQ